MLERLCPYCKANIPLQDCLDSPGVMPKEGDFSICFVCGGLSLFDKDLNFVELAFDKANELKKEMDPRVVAFMDMLRSTYLINTLDNNPPYIQ